MACVCQQSKTISVALLILSFLLIIAGCGGGSGSGGGSGGGSTGVPGTHVILTWEAPTTNEDGTALTDLAGYKVYYGQGSGNYNYSVGNGNNIGVSISNLTTGTWCFAVSSYDTSGNESEFSDEVCTFI